MAAIQKRRTWHSIVGTSTLRGLVLGSGFSLLALAACQGHVDGLNKLQRQTPTDTGSTPGDTPLDGMTPDQVLASAQCKAPSPGRAPLRRLTNAEYRNTLTDLLGTDSAPLIATATQSFLSETESLGFRNNADYLAVSTTNAQGYVDAGEQVLDAIVANKHLLSCSPAPGAELDCARTFIRDFGKLAFRRPLTDAELAQYEAIYAKAMQAYDFASAVRFVALAFLQSPHFLYRVEFGAAPSGAYTAPSPYEMANRLSYLFWQSMPDQALFDAAAAGQLGTPDQIRAQATRLLADPKAARLLEYFDEWLGTDTLASGFVRDATLYPNLDPNLPTLLQQETRAFVSDVLSRPQGSLTELLTAPYTFANASLAKHYGLSNGNSSDSFVKVDAPGRAGVLTQGMLLARDKATRTSIVRRGLKIRLDLLCEKVSPPPPNVNVNLEQVADGLTQRQRLEQHRTSPGCATCHSLMDPIGVVFEGLDAVGRARTQDEQGAPIDAHTFISNTEDADGPANTPADLGQLLAKSEEVRTCYVTKSFRFFYGRDVETPDACSMAQLLKSFQGNAYSLSQLLVQLTQTDAFLYRPIQSPEAP